MTTPTNPLLQLDGFIAFDQLHANHIDPALDTLLGQAQQAISTLNQSSQISYSDLVHGLHRATEPLARAWNVISHLTQVTDDAAWQAAYQKNIARISAFWTDLGQNPGLYQQYRQLASDNTLSPTQQRVIHLALREFEHSGAALNEMDKAQLKEIFQQLAQKNEQFSDHVTQATDATTFDLPDAAALDGLPAAALQEARQAAQLAGIAGYRITLHAPSYLPVLQYAKDRDLRAQVYRAVQTRASDLGDAAHDNSALMTEILALRQQAAKLLGFAHYADLSLDSKMADSIENVTLLLDQLAVRAEPMAKKERQQLEAFAADHCQLDTLEAWDVPFVAEKMRRALYDYSEEEVRAYFPEEKVWAGLFQLVRDLFEVELREMSVAERPPTWHPTVRVFALYQAQRLIGHCYLDPYARTGKRGGAWMDGARGFFRHGNDSTTPIAYLVCNFTPPIANQPCYLSHDDVTTLFHEFGHGLHHLLTQVEEANVAGINGVEWDGVELPSQFMENFCWDWRVLEPMTKHRESGAAMPRALFDKLLASQHYLAASMMLRQVAFSRFDLLLHAHAATDVLEFWRTIERTTVIQPAPAFARQPHTFSHIFAGGYAAGYYSYKWAEVMSADAYAAFEEALAASNQPQTTLRQVGQRYLQEILAQGGARPMAQSFAAFRGRAPTVDALLRHSGLELKAA